MIYFIAYRGDPLPKLGTWSDDLPYVGDNGLIIDALLAAKVEMYREFKRRWPRAFWGFQEAAAHGLTIQGRCQLTAAEARQLREELSIYDDRPRPKDLVLEPIYTDEDGQELRKRAGLPPNETSPWEEYLKAYRGQVVID